MIDTKKVRLMTRIAVYEQSEGQRDLKMNRYSRKSFIALKELESILAITAVFAMLALLCEAYLLLAVVSKGETVQFKSVAAEFGVIYVIALVLSLIVTRFRSAARYDRMRKNIEAYEKDLEDFHAHFS